MESDGTNTQTAFENAGWLMTSGVALLQVLAGSMLLVFSGPETFEADTGVLWSDLTGAYPTIATQFTMVRQSSLIGTLGIGLFALLVSINALRTGQRWAWFALWILPLSIAPGALSLLQAENQAGPGILGFLLAFLAATGIGLSARRAFSDPQ